eukprot:9588458-Alexandrium_andersonii.AAC.1
MGARRARRVWTDSVGASWVARALRSLLNPSVRTVGGPGFGKTREFIRQARRTPAKRPNR